jgi:hypothetical protein
VASAARAIEIVDQKNNQSKSNRKKKMPIHCQFIESYHQDLAIKEAEEDPDCITSFLEILRAASRTL